jgi:hypothetical protein
MSKHEVKRRAIIGLKVYEAGQVVEIPSDVVYRLRSLGYIGPEIKPKRRGVKRAKPAN